ncbi:dephospho-CoA kinase [Ostertagia ostertagi]
MVKLLKNLKEKSRNRPQPLHEDPLRSRAAKLCSLRTRGNRELTVQQKRRKMNSILHPAIRWEMFKQMLKYLLFGCHYIVLDTPLLFESGYHKILWTVIVVWCDDDTQLERLMLRDNLTREEANSRISSQFPIRKKMELATILIDNNGTKEELKVKVEALIRELESRWTPLIVRATVYTNF